MPSDIAIKFCGLRKLDDIETAARTGARYVGLMFFPPSPRHLELEQAQALVQATPSDLSKVGVSVNPTNTFLETLLSYVSLDMLQLHGQESPERIAEIKKKFGLPVIKAIGLSDSSDLPQIAQYTQAADQILVDAKPPKGGALPGGNALSFDWRLIKNQQWTKPWLLAGGLTPENVGQAIALTNAKQIDVSSGIESYPGMKDPQLMEKFAKAALADFP